MKPESISSDFWAWLDGKAVPRQREPEPDDMLAPAGAFGSAITGSGQRRPPRRALRDKILAKQMNRCLYCDHQFGTSVRRRGKVVTLRINWDHFVPYAYGQTNAGTNWVAACHVCNNIKSCRMFDTVRDAQAYILAVWSAKGYELRSPLARASAGAQTDDRDDRQEQ